MLSSLDVNLDGTINYADAALVINKLNDPAYASQYDLDTNGDGVVTLMDAKVVIDASNKLVVIEPGVVTEVPWTHTQPPGVVIDYENPATQRYVGSPSVVIAENGDYLATHDLFGPGSTWNTTEVFVSTDRGATWQFRTKIVGQFWSPLFSHDGAVYLIGTAKKNGSVVIRRSLDDGVTWTTPIDSTHGKLLVGSYSMAPTPVVVHAGRIWTAMQFVPAGTQNQDYKPLRPFMMSCPVGSNLLVASNWTVSNKIVPSTSWLGGRFKNFMEGNAVVTPNGGMAIMMRVSTLNYPEMSAIISVSADGKKATFRPASDFVEFPGGATKFTIRHDAVSGKYFTLSNYVPPQFRGILKPHRTRNTLVLMESTDLRYWTIKRVLLQHSDVRGSGFQYADWQIEGEDIVAVVRTAYAGAHNSHDANYLTYLRVKDFRL